MWSVGNGICIMFFNLWVVGMVFFLKKEILKVSIFFWCLFEMYNFYFVILLFINFKFVYFL